MKVKEQAKLLYKFWSVSFLLGAAWKVAAQGFGQGFLISTCDKQTSFILWPQWQDGYWL